ncbi:polysaccharide deacetylase family protein [Desulfocapsa sp. AH-315-G09]|nr:polysaccharide deacetylase family protein [Desulfocapsa sp.]MBN4048537.1 polysaccharide deacetylase family protein [bacterium AH-315-N22]MBN4065573.1 polysaccharide deacetylase family protein [Desulfocapsa sp. AH-315-G09]
MKTTIRKPHKFVHSQAEKLAVIALLISFPLFAGSSWLAPFPLVLFLLLCIIAPFCPQWGFFLPIISKSVTGNKGVALTFDDGPSPVTTPILLNLLRSYNYKATFFVIGQKAEKYPNLIADILADGHTIGNHSWQHDNLLMLRSRRRLRKDIKKTQATLETCGVHPLVFRPPVGITNPRLKAVLQEEQLLAVTFSCRAFDHGNRKLPNLAARITSKLKPGDIILLHDSRPETEEATQEWKKEISILFATLKKEGPEVVPLELLTGSAVQKF